jgi:hypothetical protein
VRGAVHCKARNLCSGRDLFPLATFGARDMASLAVTSACPLLTQHYGDRGSTDICARNIWDAGTVGLATYVNAIGVV